MLMKGFRMAGGFKHWISLLINRFARNKNIDGDYLEVEASAIPTVTYLAEWARDRGDISEMWVFGSALDKDRWDSLSDDLDVLFLVPDNAWTGDKQRDIPREAPLSEHYLKCDIRAMRETDAEPWRTFARTSRPVSKADPDDKESFVEHVMRHGVMVWRREDDQEQDKR